VLGENLKVILAAVPGAGKTTTLQIFSKMKPHVKIVNFGDYMMKIANEKFGIKKRDDMRKKLSLEDYRWIQVKAAEEIANISGDLIVDTHLAIRMEIGYYPGMPKEVISKLKPDIIVLLEFDPKVILERRRKDLTIKGKKITEIGTVVEKREREIENEEDIELHQQMNRYFAAAAANEVQATVKIINLRNIPQTRLFEHAETGAKILASLFG